MVEQQVTVQNKVGLHARPAALLVKTASGFACEVAIVKDGKSYNAKSILSVMSAAVKQGDSINVTAIGEGEAQALAAVVALINSGLGER